MDFHQTATPGGVAWYCDTCWRKKYGDRCVWETMVGCRNPTCCVCWKTKKELNMERDIRTEAFEGRTAGEWIAGGPLIAAEAPQFTPIAIIADPDVSGSDDPKAVTTSSPRFAEAMANRKLIAAAPALLADRDRWRKVADGLYGAACTWDDEAKLPALAAYDAAVAGSPAPAKEDVKPGWWWLRFRGDNWRVVQVLNASEYIEPEDGELSALSYALEHGEWQGPILPPERGAR